MDIQFDCRETNNSANSNILEDFFAMTKFDASIHGDSNFSICAGLISDYKIEMRAMPPIYPCECSKIDRVCTRIKHKQDI